MKTAPPSRAWLGLWLALAGCRIEPVNGRGAPATVEPDLRTQIAEVLDGQAAAWNVGDLEAFMGAYERGPSTTYIGNGGLLEGYEAIRARYAPEFESEAERDSLRFAQLRAREIDPRFAIATGRYLLHRGGEITSSGPFSLVLMNVEGAWKIVHDQSAEDTMDDNDAAGEDEPADETEG